MANLINKDCWNIIAGYGLTEKDLLSLRATCKYMNNMVKSLNELWFKAHQWFLISTSDKSKAKSASKVHNYNFGYGCVKDEHPLLSSIYRDNGWYSKYSINELKTNLIQKGELTLNDCSKKYHWKVIVPKCRNDIPHEGYNKKNQYIYYYLIECYRYYNKKHEAEIRQINKEIDELQVKVNRYYQVMMEKEILSKKYVDNDVFKNRRVDQYKSI